MENSGTQRKGADVRLSMDTLSSRQREILNMVNEIGYASIEALASKFNVTPQTIRRDINRLCDSKLLQRHHGGASRTSSVENVDYSTRQNILLQEKQRIAQMVVQQIPDRASLFINLGTTTEEVARLLADHKKLKVITNNLNVALTMSRNKDCDVIIAGGMVRHRDQGITGEATVEFIRQFKVDYGIIGVSGIDEDGTLMDYDYHEVRVAREIIDNSRSVFLVTDHTKFTRNAMVRIADIGDIDAIFTDKNPPIHFREMLKNKEVALFVAEDRDQR